MFNFLIDISENRERLDRNKKNVRKVMLSGVFCTVAVTLCGAENAVGE